MRVLAVDTDELTMIKCPKCQHPLRQSNLTPGQVDRHHCKRCGEWTVVVVVGVFAVPDAASVLTGTAE